MASNRKGGLKAKNTLIEKYGKDYYKNLGSLGGKKRDPKKTVDTVREKYGDDAFIMFGKQGGRGNKKSKLERWLS